MIRFHAPLDPFLDRFENDGMGLAVFRIWEVHDGNQRRFQTNSLAVGNRLRTAVLAARMRFWSSGENLSMKKSSCC